MSISAPPSPQGPSQGMCQLWKKCQFYHFSIKPLEIHRADANNDFGDIVMKEMFFYTFYCSHPGTKWQMAIISGFADSMYIEKKIVEKNFFFDKQMFVEKFFFPSSLYHQNRCWRRPGKFQGV